MKRIATYILWVAVFFFFTGISYSQVIPVQKIKPGKNFSGQILVKGRMNINTFASSKAQMNLSLNLKFQKGLTGFRIMRVKVENHILQKGVDPGNYYLYVFPFSIRQPYIYSIMAEIGKTGDKTSTPVHVKLATIKFNTLIKKISPHYTAPVPYSVWKNGLEFSAIFSDGVLHAEAELREVPPQGMIFRKSAPGGKIIVSASFLKPGKKYGIELAVYANKKLGQVQFYRNTAPGSYIHLETGGGDSFSTGPIVLIKK